MRAAVLNQGQMLVRDDVPEPVPASGQVLCQVKACGICGSDLHFAKHGEDFISLSKDIEGMGPGMGGDGEGGLDLSRDIYMGHELCVEVLDHGPDTQGPKPGTLVTSIPVLFGPAGVQPIVYSNEVNGGYGERMLLNAMMLLEIPNGLSATHAALTEPMAVGLHAVNLGRLKAGDGAVVVGCGPVGLAVIGALKAQGCEHIVAADFSPTRRRLAEGLGAHVTIDPRDETAFAAWRRTGGPRACVVFEAIGVPGILNEIMRAAPSRARVVVVGVCMEPDRVNPFYAAGKELNIQFSMGYSPDEFAGSLRNIAEGVIDVAPLVTAEVGLDGVAQAFDDLGNPEEHCKIIVAP